ncbi:MAG: type I 3-dehydroquinate dehydratase [Nitrososphaeraceae archaeon]
MKICASIAPENINVLEELLKKAKNCHADFIEIRFDFLEESEIQESLEFIKPISSRSVFTLRSKSQNGKFNKSEKERIFYLRLLSKYDPMFLDVELDALKTYPELLQYLNSNKVNILVSHHDFSSTPSIDALQIFFKEMKNYSNNIKLITTANNLDDSFRILDLYQYSGNSCLISFAMGDYGVLSRILSTLVGTAPFTYASLDKTLAPGQIDILTLRKIYDRIKQNRSRYV